MAKIKIKACGYSMEASGSDEFVAREREAFLTMVNGNIGKAVAGLYATRPKHPMCRCTIKISDGEDESVADRRIR